MEDTTKYNILYILIIFFITIALANKQDYKHQAENHPCYRECSTDTSKSMVCGYNFTLDYYWVLSKACYNCPNKTEDCERWDCIPADGVRRSIAIVNRMLPGPSIRVCEGDTVVVDVHNNLFGEISAIHWHGIHQKKTPWFDGVPHVTQCGIPPGSSFRYEFETPLSGTYYWHSHAGFQRADGIFGSLIVRKPKRTDLVSRLYNFDLPEHEIIIWDFLNQLTLENFLAHHHDDGDNKPKGVLINGKGFPPGFFEDFPENETMEEFDKPFVPIYEARVKRGNSYRFRIISNGVLNCPLEFSIENHTMNVISSDGFDLDPVVVNSLVIYAGERWDLVISANQKIGSYWMKFRGLMDCDDRFTKAFQLAVLNYDEIPKGTLPDETITNWYDAAAPVGGLQLNPLNIAPGVEGVTLTVPELSTLFDNDPEIVSREIPDHQFYLSYDFNEIDNFRFHGPHIPIRTVRKGHKLYTPQLNFISHVMPSSPLLSQPETLDRINSCNESSLKEANQNCEKEYCECVHLIRVELNSIVELVLVDRGYRFDANHPFHLHGHHFRVMAMERLSNTTEPFVIQNLDRKGMILRRKQNAVIKDTVTVPDGGYTILRFRADNPGFWFFHCHIIFHAEVGMGVIFQVGELNEMPKVPDHFPKCGDYTPEIDLANGPMQVGKEPHFISPEQNNTHYDFTNMTTTTEQTDSSSSGKTKSPISTRRTRKPRPNSGNKISTISTSIISHFILALVPLSNNLYRIL